MLHVIWEFFVPETQSKEFERCYGPAGTWAQLFRKSPAFRGTQLLRDLQNHGRYLTIDIWENQASYEKFRRDFGADYITLDEEMAELTSSERRIGWFAEL